MTEYTVNPNNEAVPTTQPVEEGSGGYINTSSQVPTEYAREQEQKASVESQVADKTYDELSQKLGVDLDQLDKPPAPEQPKPSEAELQKLAALKSQIEYLKKFDTEQGKAFRKQFQEYMGVDPVTAFASFNETQKQLAQFRQWQAKVENEKSVETLKKEWGDDFESTWTEVRERFNKLPDNMKKSLDNIDGARLLAAKIQQEKFQGIHNGVPQFQSNRGANSMVGNIRSSGTPQGYVKTSDYFNDKVTEAEYIQALRLGRVIRDM